MPSVYWNFSRFYFSVPGALHCTKRVRIRSYSGLHFSAFALNVERYEVRLAVLYIEKKLKNEK